MFIKVIEHHDLSPRNLIEIINIKDQHWNYGYESQKQWIENQFSDNDLHILAISDNKICSYVGINKVWCIIDEVKYDFFGIGNVCVDIKMQGHGIGSKVIEFVNEYLSSNNKNGVLLCNDLLISFYEHLDWQLLKYNLAFTAEKSYMQNIMTFNFNLNKINSIILEKDF